MSGDTVGKIILWGIAFWFFDGLFAWIIAILFIMWAATLKEPGDPI